MDVRVYNTNTDSIVVQTVELDDAGEYEEWGEYNIPGVSTTGSEVKCAFVDPAGSMTGKMFPTGHQQEVLHIPAPAELPAMEAFDVRVTLIDAANPFVLIDATSIALVLKMLPSQEARHVVAEAIRREGAVAMGLAPNVEKAALTRGTPKVAFLHPPVFSQDGKGTNPDIRVEAYSMGLPHPSLQLTGAVCLGAALSCHNTIAAELSRSAVVDDNAPPTPARTPSPSEKETNHSLQTEREVVIAHSKGTIKVGVVMRGENDVASCAVSRTARRLFEGRVRYFV